MMDNNLEEKFKKSMLDYEKYQQTTGRFFDRNGTPISVEKYVSYLSDFSYRRINLTSIENFSISTIWLGINHNFNGKGAPLIFETMVFYQGDDKDHELQNNIERYATESEALEGHKQMCELVMKYIEDHKEDNDR